MQPREEIAYLGPNASYTHQAAISAFDPEHHKLLPQTTIEDVFSSVQSGRATYGVVPFENSTNGSVVFTLDLFADQHRKHPDIVVCGERYVEVHHCLLGRPAPAASHSNNSDAGSTSNSNHVNNLPKVAMQQQDARSPSSSGHATPVPGNPNPNRSRSVPLTSLAHIKKLYSHPQAWGQCKTFLSCHLKGVERQDVSSTSRAAELVAADETGTTAAISSGIAAQMHHVDFLARDIEDDSNNCTRFLILRRIGPGDSTHAAAAAAAAASITDTDGENGATSSLTANDNDNNNDNAASAAAPTTSYKSLLSFTVRHTDPGALADALAVFKRHNLNLTSINPRPSGETPWHYIFFVEFQGRKGQRAVDCALAELDRVVSAWRWLGSWENALVRGGAADAPASTVGCGGVDGVGSKA